MRRNPLAADTRTTPTNALAYFTDREDFQAAFHRHTKTPSPEDLSVLVFYGVGGIGKTTLLRKLAANAGQADPPLPCVRYNLENVGDQAAAYREVLLRLRSDFESEFSLKFPNFDLALSVLIAQEGGQRPSLVKMSPGLDSAFTMALELMPGLVKSGVKIAGTQLQTLIHRSELLERWVRQAGGTEAVLALSEQFTQEEQAVPEELIRRFAQDLAAGLSEQTGKTCRGVLLLDTYEALWTGREDSLSAQARHLDDWVRHLAEYLMGAGVLLVIAGRDRLGWGDADPEWEACLDQHLLGGVSNFDAQLFLARRGIGAEPPAGLDPLQAAILRCANTAAGAKGEPGCHLLALALSADIAANTRGAGREPDPALFSGVPPAEMARELASRFLKSLHNRNLELWVEALSLTPRFDEAAALALDTARHLNAGRAGWEQLQHYSFVSAQPNGFFRLHRTMREVLRPRSPAETTRSLHEWFAFYWEQRGEDALAFYHHWSLDPATALNEWKERHTAAVSAVRMEEARALLNNWAEVESDDDDRALMTAPLWAKTHAVLGAALDSTPLRPRYARQIAAAAHFRAALTLWTESASPEKWADVQNQLGAIYLNLPTADRTESLAWAEECFQAALRVSTEAAAPFEWAKAQSNLGLLAAYRSTGDRAENLRVSMGHFQAAQRVWTPEAYPRKWANMQNNRGCDLLLMPGGDKAAHLREAAALFEANLKVEREDTEPALWAKTQHNLGIVYFEQPEGDRVANIYRSISHYRAALRVHTEEALPDVWAETQFSLGTSHAALPVSEETVGEAIAHYEAALRVWTEAENPERWAQAQNGLGRVVAGRPGEGREQNLKAAVTYYRNALRIHTEEAYPDRWAEVRKNLGTVLRALAQIENAPSLEDEARRCFLASARGYRAVGMHPEAEAAEAQAISAAPS